MTIGITADSKKDPIKAEGDRLSGIVDFEFSRPTSDIPLHVVFCIDTSPSMSGSRIETAREGLARALDEVSPKDQFAVCGFSGSASTILSPTSGAHATQHKSDVRELTSGGWGTDIIAGVRQSKQLLQQMPNEKAITWVVLITDGGDSVDHSILRNEFGEEGITIYTAGIGNYDKDVVKNTAELTQGEWQAIKQPNELQTFFREKVAEARDVVAINPELRLTPGASTEIQNIYYTLGDQQSTVDPETVGTEYIVNLSDLNSNKPPTVRVDLHVDAVPQVLEVLTATLETRDHRDADTIEVEVAPPFIAEEENEGDSGMADLAVAEAIETALEENPAAGKAVIEEYKEEHALDNSTKVSEAEETIDKLATNKSGETEEEATRVLGKLDDE